MSHSVVSDPGNRNKIAVSWAYTVNLNLCRMGRRAKTRDLSITVSGILKL